jgi:Tol biopolymer transport system component
VDTGSNHRLVKRPSGVQVKFDMHTLASYRRVQWSRSYWAKKSSGLTNVTGSMGVSEFAWSPDGSMLAFTAFQEGNDFDVFVVNADGTGLRAVVESPWGPESRFAT